MMDLLMQIIKQWFRKRNCIHNKDIFSMKITDWSIIEKKPRGVTLGWDARPHVSWHTTCHCDLCGERFERQGYNPYDKTPRNDNDWPLNADGSKMEIAQ